MAIDRPSEIKQHDAVLLYNHDDHESIIAIYQELKRRGLNPWMDSQEIPFGADWRKAVVGAIQQASSAVIFSGAKDASRWQEEELSLLHRTCVDRGIREIPALLPGGRLPEDLLFSTKTPVMFTSGPLDLNALDQLEFAIRGHDPRKLRGHAKSPSNREEAAAESEVGERSPLAIDPERLILGVIVGKSTPLDEVADEVVKLYEALNAAHVASGGSGLVVDDWQMFIEQGVPVTGGVR